MISNEIKSVIESIPAFRTVVELFQFNPREIEPPDDIDEVLAKAVWVAVPFHIFVISRVYADDLGVMLVLALGSFIFVLVYGNILALFDLRAKRKYGVKARQWSIACITLWTLTVMLLSLSYLLAWPVASGRYDLIGYWCCGQTSYPDHQGETFLVYLVYSIFAAVAVGFLAFWARRSSSEEIADGGPSVRGGHSSFPAGCFVLLVLCNAIVLYLSIVVCRIPKSSVY